MTSYAQWDSIGSYSMSTVITSENVGYDFSNEPYGSHGNQATLYKTEDGFTTWTKIYQQQGDVGCCSIGNIFFCNDSVGFMSTYDAGNGGFYRTLNGGSTWSFCLGGAPQTNVYFLRPSFGYAIWPGYATPTGKGAIHLYNGHDTVQFLSTQYTFIDEWIYFINDSTGFISCRNSSNQRTILRTSDFGISWSPLADSLGKEKLIQFPDNTTGYFLNYAGDLYASHDLGSSWQLVSRFPDKTLNYMFFLNPDKGYIVGNNSLILKTLDGGEHWQTEFFKPGYDLFRIKFVNDTIGFLVAGIKYYGTYDYQLYKTYPSVFVTEKTGNPANIRIRPNPAHTRLNLEFPSGRPEPDALEIISVTGETMIRLDRFQPVINTSGLPPGLYCLKYRISEKQGLIRFIISTE